MHIQEILAKYEKFYKGGHGYTFQVNVDDFNKIVEYIATLEQVWNEKELMEQLDGYFKNTSKEQLLNDLAETGCMPYMENENKLEFEVSIEGDKSYFETVDEVIDKIKADTFFEVDGEALRTNINYWLDSNDSSLNLTDEVYIKRILKDTADVTTIELLPNSKKVEKGTQTIDSGDCLVEVLEVLNIQNVNGHTFVDCKVKFL